MASPKFLAAEVEGANDRLLASLTRLCGREATAALRDRLTDPAVRGGKDSASLAAATTVALALLAEAVAARSAPVSAQAPPAKAKK